MNEFNVNNGVGRSNGQVTREERQLAQLADGFEGALKNNFRNPDGAAPSKPSSGGGNPSGRRVPLRDIPGRPVPESSPKPLSDSGPTGSSTRINGPPPRGRQQAQIGSPLTSPGRNPATVGSQGGVSAGSNGRPNQTNGRAGGPGVGSGSVAAPTFGTSVFIDRPGGARVTASLPAQTTGGGGEASSARQTNMPMNWKPGYKQENDIPPGNRSGPSGLL